ARTAPTVELEKCLHFVAAPKSASRRLLLINAVAFWTTRPFVMRQNAEAISAPTPRRVFSRSFAQASGRVVAHSSGADSSCPGLDANTVIHGRCNSLGAAEITLCCLHGNVPKQKLNLLQFAAGGTAEPSTTSTEIVRREFADADRGGELLDDVPDQ